MAGRESAMTDAAEEQLGLLAKLVIVLAAMLLVAGVAWQESRSASSSASGTT